MNPPNEQQWLFSDALESRAQITLARSYDLFINGEFTASSGNKKYWSINPSDETRLARVTESTSEDVDRGVSAARN